MHLLHLIYLADLAMRSHSLAEFRTVVFESEDIMEFDQQFELRTLEGKHNPKRHLTVRSDILQRHKYTFQDSITLLN